MATDFFILFYFLFWNRIAGWKQKEHPMLYAALHIGDQLISLGGKIVNNAADAQKLIRAWPSLYVRYYFPAWVAVAGGGAA